MIRIAANVIWWILFFCWIFFKIWEDILFTITHGLDLILNYIRNKFILQEVKSK